MQPKSTLCMSHQMTFTGRACLATCGGSGPQMWPRSTSSMQLKPTGSVAAAVVTMCSPCLPPAQQPSSPHLGARLHTRGILAALPSMPASATDCQLHSRPQHQIEGQRVKPASSTPLVYHPVASLPSLAQAAAVSGMLRPRQCTWCGAHLIAMPSTTCNVDRSPFQSPPALSRSWNRVTVLKCCCMSVCSTMPMHSLRTSRRACRPQSMGLGECINPGTGPALHLLQHVATQKNYSALQQLLKLATLQSALELS